MFQIVFLVAALFAGCGVHAAEAEEANGLSVLLQAFEHYSEDELKEILGAEGLDIAALKALVSEDIAVVKEDATRAFRAGAAVASAPAALPSLATLMAQHAPPAEDRDAFLEHYQIFYATPQAATLQSRESTPFMVLKKIGHFLDTKVRGKRIEVISLVAFIIYRQISWLYLQHLKEMAVYASGHQKSPLTYSETMLGMLGFDSRAASYIDFFIRLSFCATRAYLDFSACVKEFKEMQFFADPDGFLLRVKYRIGRASALFSNPFYYGASVSLVKKALLGLALPFSWALLFSKTAAGAPLHNPLFKAALGNVAGVAAQEAGFQVQTTFEKKVKQSAQKKLFKATGGVVRERLFVDVAAWIAEYGKIRLLDREPLDAKIFFARKTGEYAIRHVYLHLLIGLLKGTTRNGGLQAVGWVGNKIGWLLAKLGFFRENPADASKKMLHAQCVSMGILEEEQPIEEVLVYPASLFPGAFARAVRRIITRQKIEPVLKRDAHFIQYLNSMHGISVYDLFRMMSVDFMVQQQMSARVARIKAAVTKREWRFILKAFLNELFIEVFFDRQRLVCQMATEPLLAAASSRVLGGLNALLLP